MLNVVVLTGRLTVDPELKNLISSIAQKQGASFSRFYGLLNS